MPHLRRSIVFITRQPRPDGRGLFHDDPSDLQELIYSLITFASLHACGVTPKRAVRKIPIAVDLHQWSRLRVGTNLAAEGKTLRTCITVERETAPYDRVAQFLSAMSTISGSGFFEKGNGWIEIGGTNSSNSVRTSEQ